MGIELFDKDFNMKEMITNSEVATLAKRIINEYLMNMPAEMQYDDKWQELFTVMSTADQYEIFPQKAQLAFTWKEVGPGDEPIFAKVTDAEDLAIYMKKKRTAAALDSDVFKYNKKLKFQYVVDSLRASGLEEIAALHYALLVASAVDKGNSGTTLLAIGTAINNVVVAMLNNQVSGKKYPLKPTHVVCNYNDTPVISKSISKIDRLANIPIDYKGTNAEKLPLNEATYGLKIIETSEMTSGQFLIVEAKKHLISLEDVVDKGVILDDEYIKLIMEQRLYGLIRRGIGNLFATNTYSGVTIGSVNKLTIA